MTDALHTAIDEAGRALLKRCGAVGEDGKTVSIPQQVEVFQALCKWAEVRHKISPPPVEEGSQMIERPGDLKVATIGMGQEISLFARSTVQFAE